MHYGVKQYILKPTDPNLLIKALREEISGRAAEQEAVSAREKMQRQFKKWLQRRPNSIGMNV